MKLCMISNFFNHHQSALCDYWYKILKADFLFIASKPLPLDKQQLGYPQLDRSYVQIIESDTAILKAVERFDVILVGDCSEAIYMALKQTSKVLFLTTERIFKDTPLRRFSPIARRNMKNLYEINAKENHFLLCAGSYVAQDFAYFNVFLNKAYTWGYFPVITDLSFEQLKTKKKENYFLWVGRFLDWKHPKMAIKVAVQLKKKKIPFTMDLVGEGPQYHKIANMIQKYHLENHVQLTGPLPVHEVQSKMQEATYFLFTSDYREGWGAVLNEAMACGCICFGNIKAGSTLTLLNHSNGIPYSKNLPKLVISTLNDTNKVESLAYHAYTTIHSHFNAPLAAHRLLHVAKHALNHESKVYESGPLSKAPLITNKKARKFF